MKCLKTVMQNSLNESLSFNRLNSKQWDSDTLKDFISSFLTSKDDINLFINNYANNINEYSLEIKNTDYEGLACLDTIKSRTLNLLDCNYDKLLKILKTSISNNIQDVLVYWYHTGNGLRTIVFDMFDGKTSYINILGQDDAHAVFDVLQDFDIDNANLYLYTKNQ